MTKPGLGLALAALTIPAIMPAADAAPLSRTEQKIVRYIDEHPDDVLSLLQSAVDIPSATENLSGVRAVGELYRAELERLGFTARWVELPPEMQRAGHLVAEHAGKRGKRVLLIGHLDTVLEGERYSREGNIARGTGTSDMKGGNAVVIAALKALRSAGALDGRVAVVFTGDEEHSGLPLEVSRKALVDEAKKSDVALAFESAEPGTGTVARRGIIGWKLEVAGTTGHSSRIFTNEMGSGAILETARILEAFRESLGSERYLTFNPSVIVGGSKVEYEASLNTGRAEGKSNVIPRTVFVEGDLRFISSEQFESAKSRMQQIVAQNLPRTSAALTFSGGYPAMAPTKGNYELLSELDRVSRDLGLGPITPLDPGRRGAGDIAFVAPYVSGLDGLGATGGKEHAPGEFVQLDAFPAWVKRTAILIYRLTR